MHDGFMVLMKLLLLFINCLKTFAQPSPDILIMFKMIGNLGSFNVTLFKVQHAKLCGDRAPETARQVEK